MSETMTFRLGESGCLEFVEKEMKKNDDIIDDIIMAGDLPRSTSKYKTMSYSIAPVSLMLGSAVGTYSGDGVFWDAFMTYIFPWLLDIAKVFCAIKVTQAFYMEKRGGRDEGTGMGAFVTYGKWYLLFWITPWAIELIDQIGSKMLFDLRNDIQQ